MSYEITQIGCKNYRCLNLFKTIEQARLLVVILSRKKEHVDIVLWKRENKDRIFIDRIGKEFSNKSYEYIINYILTGIK